MNPQPIGTPARRLRDAIEPFHGMCYYVPEVRAHYVDDLGLHPWSAYFGQRAAAMGVVGPEVVTAVFYGFSPGLVRRSIPSVWDHISPSEAWSNRIDSAGAALRRMLGEIDLEPIEEAADLAQKAMQAMEIAGRPLGAAHAAMDTSDDPIARLWRNVTALREFRGDGHVAALVSTGVGPIESLVTASSFSNLSRSFHQRARGWTEAEWGSGVERCRRDGWIDDHHNLTEKGNELRLSIEETTDASMAAAVAALDADELERLIEVVGTASGAIVASDGFPA